MSNRIDQELARVIASMSETAPPKPDLDMAAEPSKTAARRPVWSTGWVLASLALALGLVGSVAVLTNRDSAAPMLVAMGNADEPTAVVGTFPHLLIDQPGWALIAVDEGFDSVSYTYARGNEQATIFIEFGDQDALNSAIADTVSSLDDPYVVQVDEVDEQQVAILGTDDRASDTTAVWGDAGRIFRMVTAGIGSFDDVYSILASLTVADDAQWANAQERIS